MKVAIVQRVLPRYRLAFFNEAAGACASAARRYTRGNMVERLASGTVASLGATGAPGARA